MAVAKRKLGERVPFAIGGRERFATFRHVAVDDVILDHENPRVRYKLSQRGAVPTQEELRDILVREAGADDLMRRVRENGGLLEPVFLRPDLRVIEGNCRVAVCARLKKARPALARLPAWVFDEIDDRDVAVLQGAYHVAGKTKWRSYEQAGHLHYMHHTLEMTTKDIAKEVGVQDRVVRRLLDTYQAMTTHILPALRHDGLAKFSYFEELYKREDLADFRAKPENVKLTAALVIEGKLNKGAQVRILPQIISHNALPVLRSKGFDAAMEVVGKVEPTVGDPFAAKLEKFTETLRKAPASFVRKARSNARTRAMVERLRDAAAALIDESGTKPPARRRR